MATRRENVPGEGGNAGTIVLLSSVPAGNGCQQPHLDMLRPVASGRYSPTLCR